MSIGTFLTTQWKRPGSDFENFSETLLPKKGSKTSALAGDQYNGSTKKLTDGTDIARGTSFLSLMSPRDVDMGTCAQYCF
jgi:hypothetical protein